MIRHPLRLQARVKVLRSCESDPAGCVRHRLDDDDWNAKDKPVASAPTSADADLGPSKDQIMADEESFILNQVTYLHAVAVCLLILPETKQKGSQCRLLPEVQRKLQVAVGSVGRVPTSASRSSVSGNRSTRLINVNDLVHANLISKCVHTPDWTHSLSNHVDHIVMCLQVLAQRQLLERLFQHDMGLPEERLRRCAAMLC